MKRLLLLVALAAVPACLEARRPAASDTVGATDADVAAADTATLDTLVADTAQSCEGDLDCADLAAPPCRTAGCVDQRCVVVDAPTTTACGDPIGGSCDGEVFVPPALCDGAGGCPVSAVPCDASPDDCFVGSCDAVAGCTSAPRGKGSACVAGASGVCDGTLWHAADSCGVAGACLDAGVSRCPAAFCELATCGDSGCGTSPIGLDPAAAGAWQVFFLRLNDATVDSVDTARTLMTFETDGRWVRAAADLVTSGFGSFPLALNGRYCAGAGGAIALELGTTSGAPHVFSGHITASRDLFYAASEVTTELLVGVRRGAVVSGATVANRRFRLVGLVKNLVGSSLYGITGQVDFGEDRCVLEGSDYARTGEAEPIVLVPGPSSCLTIASDGQVEFSHEERGVDGAVVRVKLVGQAVGDADVVLMTTVDLNGGLFPSLIALVREEPDASPGSLGGVYGFGGLEAATTAPFARAAGEITYDGAGHIDRFLLIRDGETPLASGGLPEGDYAVASAQDTPLPLRGSYSHSVHLAVGYEHRAGQIAPHAPPAPGRAASARSPVVVYTGITPEGGVAASLWFGVRLP